MTQPFEQLSRQDKATVISKRWPQLGRNRVLSATVGSMQEAWTKGDYTLLKDTQGQQLFGTGSVATEAPAETPAPAPVVSPGVDPLDVLLAQRIKATGIVGTNEQDVKRISTQVVQQLTPQIARTEAEAVYERLNRPQPIEVVLKADDGTLTKMEGKTHHVMPRVLRAIKRRDSVWLAGPAGVGKTHLVHQIATTLDRPFFRISCGPQTPASIVFGHTTSTGGYAPGIAYMALSTEGAVLLFDEFDRMNPQVAVMCNGLLDGHPVTFPNGETLSPKPSHVYVVAANTFGKPSAEFGTAQRQDPSTMSRFAKIYMAVDEQLERDVFGNNEWVQHVQKVRQVCTRLGITSMAVTPRASEYGVRALKDGETREDVEEMYLYAGVPQEDVLKIKANLR